MVIKTFSKLNSALKSLLLFLLLIVIECILLVLVALIPKNAVQHNFQQSANYLCEQDVFFYANHWDKASKIDRYADSILLNIAYNYQSHNPLYSVMSSSYYFTEEHNENTNFQIAVNHNPSPNLEYSRYWHGSIAILRPLMLIFNIEQLYIFNSVVLFILLLITLVLITKHIGKAGVCCFIIASIMCSIWYVPMSLEYTWTFFITLIISIIVLLKLKKQNFNYVFLFLTAGNITAYFDFLTTETLTFLIPTVLIVTFNYLSGDLGCFIDEFKTIIKHGIYWLMGYLFTWIAKWSIASIVLQKNVFLSALSQAKYRTVGETDELSGFSQRLVGEGKNISNLFPFSMSHNHSLLFALSFFVIIICTIFIIKENNNVFNQLLLIIACLPYIRFFILGNHSYLHHFFTFRAQLVTIFCLGLMLVYGCDKKLLSKEWKKLWRKAKKATK